MNAGIIFAAPCFNEIANLPRFLARCEDTAKNLNRKFFIIIVDDGSTDNTASFLNRHPLKKSGRLKLVSFKKNQGVGHAFSWLFKESVRVAHKKNWNILITMEADNTNQQEKIKQMISQIEEDGMAVSLGSCYAPGGKVQGTDYYRRLLSWAANLFVKIVFFPFHCRNISTFSSFFRAYKISELNTAIKRYGDLWITSNGFECMVEIIIKLAALRLPIGEVPVIVNGDLRRGASKMRIRRTIIGYFSLVLKLWLPKRFVQNYIVQKYKIN